MTGRNHARWWKGFALAAAIARSGSVGAQGPVELGHADLEAFPSAEVDGQPELEVRVVAGRVGVTVPVPLTDRIVLLAGAKYEILDVGSSGFQEPRIERLQAVSLNLGSAVKVTDRILATVTLGGGLASDFERGDGFDHPIVTFAALGSYRLWDAFTVGAGVAYDTQVGTLRLLPLLSLDLRFSANARLRGVVPTSLHLEYRMLPWLTLGARGVLEGNRYHLSGEKFGVGDPELAYSLYAFGPKLTFSATPRVHVDLYATVATFRRFELFLGGESAGSDSLETGTMYGIRVWLGTLGWAP